MAASLQNSVMFYILEFVLSEEAYRMTQTLNLLLRGQNKYLYNLLGSFLYL